MDLERLQAELESGDLAPDSARALHEAVTRVLAGEADSLDRALGIKAAGQLHPATRRARAERDAALRRAFEHVTGPSRRSRILALGQAIQRFEAVTLPRNRWRTFPPDSFTPLQVELFHAFATGQPVPSGRSRLQEILAE